jgi:GxxExxY protein
VDKFKTIAKDIYNELGEGYDECIYHKAFEVALRINQIDYESQSMIPVSYKGYNVGEQEIDLIIRTTNNSIIELKATPELLEDDKAQLHRYIKLLKARNGLLVNFTQCGKAKKKDYSKLYTSDDLEPEYYCVGEPDER